MRILKAVLGWANPDTERDNLRMYALDQGDSPRWAPRGGRTIEYALITNFGEHREGDRYLIVRLGDRFVSDELIERVTAAIERELGD